MGFRDHCYKSVITGSMSTIIQPLWKDNFDASI